MRKGIAYYPWYKSTSLPIVGGGFWGSGSTNNPILGQYDSHDHEIVYKHSEWIKEAGFDFVYINLTSIDGPDIAAIEKTVIPLLQYHDLNFAFFIDSYQAVNKLNRKDFMNMNGIYDNNVTRDGRFNETLDWIIKFSQSYDNYEKINGRPLIYLYIARDFFWTNENTYLETKNKLQNFFAIGDMIDWTPIKWKLRKAIFNRFDFHILSKFLTHLYSKLLHRKNFYKFKYTDFDLVTWYNLAQPFVIKNLLVNIEELIDDLKLNKNKISMTIMPGYDDSKLSLSGYPMKIDRENGNFMLSFFKSIYAYSDITYSFVSFNEWHEGTEIEPSVEHGFFFLHKLAYLNSRL